MWLHIRFSRLWYILDSRCSLSLAVRSQGLSCASVWSLHCHLGFFFLFFPLSLVLNSFTFYPAVYGHNSSTMLLLYIILRLPLSLPCLSRRSVIGAFTSSTFSQTQNLLESRTFFLTLPCEVPKSIKQPLCKWMCTLHLMYQIKGICKILQ